MRSQTKFESYWALDRMQGHSRQARLNVSKRTYFTKNEALHDIGSFAIQQNKCFAEVNILWITSTRYCSEFKIVTDNADTWKGFSHQTRQQSPRFFRPCVLPDQNFHTTLFKSLISIVSVQDLLYNKFPGSNRCLRHCEGLLLIVLTLKIRYQIVPAKKTHPTEHQSEKSYPIWDQNDKIYFIFLTNR